MKPVSIVWDRKLLWLQELVLLVALIAAAYGWLALPVATAWHLALHVITAAGMIALIALAVMLARQSFGPMRWTTAALGPLALTLIVAAGAPYLLLNWVPELSSLSAQAISAAIRFLLAGLLVTGALLWFWANATDERP